MTGRKFFEERLGDIIIGNTDNPILNIINVFDTVFTSVGNAIVSLKVTGFIDLTTFNSASQVFGKINVGSIVAADGFEFLDASISSDNAAVLQ